MAEHSNQMSKSRADCPFCRQEAIEPQVIAETAGFLVAADLHPLVPGHLLLIPREHLRCYAELPAGLASEFAELKAQAADFLTASYGAPAFFEHGIAGQTVPHAHLHAVPGLAGLIQAVGRDRELVAGSLLDARTWLEQRGPYLYCEEGGDGVLLEPGPVPPGYLQRVAAGLLGAGAEARDGRELAEAARLNWQRYWAVRSGRPIELIACFLRRGDRVCLFLRSPALTSAPSKWHVVSGYVPQGRQPLSHALREIEEETGLDAAQVRVASIAEPVLLQRDGDVRRWRVHAFLFDVLAGEPRLNWEHVDLRWVPMTEVGTFDTVAWVPRLLERLTAVEGG